MLKGRGCWREIAAQSARNRERRRQRSGLFGAGLWLLAVLLHPAVGRAQNEQRSLGFSKLVLRIEGADPALMARADFGVLILGELKNQGFAVVGGEGVLPDQSRGSAAELLLGGTVHGLECRNMLEKGGACRLSIDWELLDARRDAVVYRVLTRAAAYRFDYENPAGVGSYLVLAALRSLTQRAAFRARQLRAESPPAFVDVADPLPSFDPELDAQKAQAAAARRAHEEAELQQRMATAARESKANEQSQRIATSTPAYVKVIKWAGVGLAVAGGIAAVTTYSAFDAKETKQGDFERLKLGNDLGWLAMGLGAASFGLSFALTPSLPAGRSALPRRLAVELKPNQWQVRLCF